MKAQTIDLNLASNPLGPLSGEVRVRIVAVIERPCDETWDDAHCVILNRESWMTLWQAVMAIDPTFPTAGPVTSWVEDDGPLGGHSEPVSGWERIPDAETIIQAVNYATR